VVVLPAIQQLKTIGAFGRLIASGAMASVRSGSDFDLLPRPRITGPAPRLAPSDVERFVRATGADPELYRAPGQTFFVPPTFFATWALPELAGALARARMPFNFARTLHAGSSVRMHRLFTCEEPLRFVASVEAVERTGARVRIEQGLALSSARGEPVLDATLSLVIPDRERSAGRTPEIVPATAKTLAALTLQRREGWRYAKLSGDFNPVHWSAAVARLSGLPGPIAHGFDLMTCVCHAVIAQIAGTPGRLRALSVSFRKPVVLPARLTLLTGPAASDTGRIPLWLGAGPGAVSHLAGQAEMTP
jgi:hypothetical protein